MVTAGAAPEHRQLYTAAAGASTTVRSDTELMRDAYRDEFVEFAAAVREGRPPAVTGSDARRALAVALACIESVRPHARSPSPALSRSGLDDERSQLAVCAEMVFTDLPLLERVRRIDELGFAVEIWDWTTQGHRRAGRDRRDVLLDDRLHPRQA